MKKDFDEKQLFELYTAEYDYRAVLTRPFAIDDNVYASNGYRIIRIDSGLLKGEYSGGNVPKNIREATERYNSIPISFNLSVTTGQLERALASIPQVDEVIETDSTEECPECHGRGVVEWYYEGRRQDYYRDSECPECDGEGYVTTTVERRTGKMVPDKNAAIGLFGLDNISTDNARVLLDTMNLLTIDEVRLVSKGEVFKFILDVGIEVYAAKLIGEPCYTIMEGK